MRSPASPMRSRLLLWQDAARTGSSTFRHNASPASKTQHLKTMRPFAIVLHGPTSAGKSSIATALQDCAPVPAFHVTLDAFTTMSRRRDMRSSDEQRLAYRLHCENLRSTLRRLVDSEFEIILDTVLRDEAELKECLDVLSVRPLCLVGIRAPLSTLEHRESQREDRATGMAREQLEHPAFARPYDLVVDTSTCTPKEGAAVIRDFIEDLRLSR